MKKRGRPQLPVPQPINIETLVDESTLLETAFGISQLKDGQYVLIRVKYNPETLQTGKVEIEKVPGDKYDVQDKFKMLVAEKLFI